MLRISVLTILMIIVNHLPDSTANAAGSLIADKDYFIAALISMLIKPWISDQFDRNRKPQAPSQQCLTGCQRDSPVTMLQFVEAARR